MSFEFLTPGGAGDGAAPVARSPMEREAMAAGARFEVRDGWNVAVAYGSGQDERDATARTGGWADVSHLVKLEVQAEAGDLAAIVARCADGTSLELGRATRAGGAWWCPITRERAFVLAEPAAGAGLRERLESAADAVDGLTSVVDVTTAFAALAVVGPPAREIFARFCALDLRPHVTPVGDFRPGSVARTPGFVLREEEDRYLMLFGWALGEYMWTVVADAARHLGAAPVGADALAPAADLEEATPRA